jgi:hypothetical protein
MFCVEITCNDCTGEDDLGCGDGRPWMLEDEGEAIKFDTREAAEAAGNAATFHVGPWRFTVKEV